MIDKPAMYLTFRDLGQDALSMNHYELEEASEGVFSANDWKIFLSEVDVQDYIKKEMAIIRASQMNRIVQEAGDSRSVGQAQLLSALQKLDNDNSEAEGPVFVYCHVPLTSEQKYAPNILSVDELGKPIE